MKEFLRLVCNLVPAQTRLDTLEGKTYTVVPMVILTEGVHAGSQGPLLYPKDELSKVPAVWNHKPIVVYHPTMNGEGISACDPVVLNSRKVGLMLNTRFEGGRLKSEAWLDKDRAKTVDERVLNAVDAKEMMELSTGVFIDVEDTTGVWKGEDYTGIARNYRPDHLALLPDKIGACSIADGAGLLRNQDSKDKGKGKNKPVVSKVIQDVLAKLGLAENEMSFNNIQSQLWEALDAKFGTNGMNGPSCYVADVYSNFFIYSRDGELYRLGYMANDTGVTLSDETPVPVTRVTQYQTTTGDYVGNQTPTANIDTNMEKKAIVDSIIAANGGWKEEDRVQLMTFNEAQLALVKNNLPKATAPAAPAAPAPEVKVIPPAPSPTPAHAAAPTANTAPITAAQYVANAPKEIQEVLSNALASATAEKIRLITVITANKSNSYSKEELEAKSLDDIKKLAQLAAVPIARPSIYSGQAPTPTENSEEEPPLIMPTINFAAK